MKSSRLSLKRLNWKVKGRLFGFGISPETDWKIIFVSTMILAVLIIALSVFVFIKIDKREIVVRKGPVEYGGEILDISILRETVLYYQNKALEFEQIRNSVVSPAGIEPASKP